MDILSAFLVDHLIEIHFLCGLSFFTAGVAFFLETNRSTALPSAQALPFLTSFCLIHGAHEWVEMFQLFGVVPVDWTFEVVRLIFLAFSLFMLIEFGLHSLTERDDQRRRWVARGIILTVFLVGEILVFVGTRAKMDAWAAAADIWCRYSLAIPGTFLTAAGFFRQGRLFTQPPPGVVGDLHAVGLAFLLYGFPGQVFGQTSPLPPSNFLNSRTFFDLFHIPVHLLHTVMAGIIALFTLRALRSIEIERQRQFDDLSRTRREAWQKLEQELEQREVLRKEFLHQTVITQEKERQYIARELHDETGQALTAITWGLATVEEMLADGSEGTIERVHDLRRLTDQVMVNLRQMTTRLRPAVLDELGLPAALITYGDDCSTRFPFVVDVQITGRRRRLPSEIETTLYRITQEGLTNVAKHAQANHVTVTLNFGEEHVDLVITDDGVGMDVELAQQAAAYGSGWGLAGICERVQLIGGRLDIQSTAGSGTTLSVQVPLDGQSISNGNGGKHA
ncbi:MAG: sensor histidine kinase [Anaerolineae bacterium]|nr:sensor histidine kinase [Anaerolineae bacterium]